MLNLRWFLAEEESRGKKKKKRKMKTRSGVFAVAITVMLLIALTLNVVSAGPPAKGSVNPEKHKVEQNPPEPYSPEPYSHGPYKVNLNPSEPLTFPIERVLNQIGYGSTVVYNAYAMYDAYNGFAVRFTPLSYPVEIITARFCFYPDCPHEQFAVYVYDDDGPDGQPGTCLGGPIYHTATDWGWYSVDLSELGVTIADDDFYILYQQLVDGPEFEGDPFTCEGLCYNLTTTCANRSWDYDGTLDEWYNVLVETGKEQDYMIRCVVNDSNAGPAAWTFMVYLDADNNLEGAGIDDFMEMSSVNASSDVNIVVQFDRIPDYDSRYGDWTGCKRFVVTAGQTPTAANATNDLGECNMGHPDTLESFVTWAKTYFPADNYALILWNRGSGWKKRASWAGDETRDDTTGIGRGVCYDDTSGDYLTLQETGDALTGRSVQLLGYDAGFMHMVEVVYQVKANVEISVGSEDLASGSWPYDTILANLNVTPTMTPRTLGTVIVQRYMNSYGYGGRETQSAVNNSGSDFSDLVTAIDDLAGALITEINAGHVDQVQQARSETVQIHYEYYIDLYHFAQKIEIEVPAAATQAQAVMDSVDVAVYAEEHGLVVPNEHGLSIYYPLEEGEYSASYDSTAFAGDTQWDEFLKKYYNPPSAQGGDIGVFRDGMWLVDTDGDCVPDLYIWYGAAGYIPLVGDINNDGRNDKILFKDGMWYVDTNGDCVIDLYIWYGTADYIPLVGDINNDGLNDKILFKDGMWYVDTNGDCVIDLYIWYGAPGYIPLVGDINNDGKDDKILFKDGMWYVDTNGDCVIDLYIWYGAAGYIPLVGDINNDGTNDKILFKDGQWYVDTNGDCVIDLYIWYGAPGYIPLVGNIG